MKLPTPYGATEPADFRSPEFRAAALVLVQNTGCSLMLCRQELFIAEGDMQHAYAALLARKAAEAAHQVRH